MAVMELWRRRDLEGTVKTEYVDGNFFTQDSAGNLVGVKCYKDGAEATLSGSVTGYCILPSGETVSVAGTRNGNQAYILIPQSALAYTGLLGVVIKLVDGNTITTLISIIVVVYRSKTDTVITPSSQIITDWSNQIAAALQDVEDASAAQDEKIDDLKSAITQDNMEMFADKTEKYIATDGVTESSASTLRCSDFIAIPSNVKTITMYIYYTKVSTMTLGTFSPICVLYDASKTKITHKNSTGHVDGYCTFDVGEAKYIRFNQSNVSVDAQNCLVRFNGVSVNDVDAEIDNMVPPMITSETGHIGHYSGTFTAKEILSTGITMKANTAYCFVNHTTLTNTVNAYGSGNTSNLKRFSLISNIVNFKNDSTDRELLLYNINSNLDSVDIDVYEFGSIAYQAIFGENVYVVDKNAVSDGLYTSLTQCLLDLKDDDREKTIYIISGDYDIYQEYVTAGVPVKTSSDTDDYFRYNVWIPNNTHIIGIGIVRLMWMPTTENNPEITTIQCQTVSPVNVAGSMTFENIEIHCKNGRYCIHDDPNGRIEYSRAIKKYKNVKCYKYTNERDSGSTAYGYANTIGFGLDREMSYEFDNCYFWNEGTGYAFYAHTRQTVGGSTLPQRHSSEIIVNNCVCDTQRQDYAVKLGNSGSSTNLRIRTAFYGCFFSGGLELINETGSGENENAYDLMMVNCNNVSVSIADSDNAYPPKIYGAIA